MRRSILYFPLLAAGILLMSCVTAPSPKAPVAELYDSTAMPSPVPAGADDHPLLLEPRVTGPFHAGVVSRPPKEMAGASGPHPAAAIPVTRSPAKALPDSPGLIPLSSPGRAVRFQLASPVAPAPPTRKPVPSPRQTPVSPSKTPAAGAAASRSPAAPRAARAEAAAAAPGSAPGTGASAPAVRGSATAAAAAPVAGAPGSATAAAATTSAAGGGGGDSYGRLREIYARQGDELQVGLDGPGFLFLGFPDRSPLADGMSFKGKETRSNKTWFTFQALKLGTYDLDFLRQENTTGKSDKETVRVHVVSEQDFSAAVNPQGSADAGPVETGDAEFAGRLTSMGAYAPAVAELQKGYREGNPGLNDQIASLYMRMGSYDAAGKYYSKNIAPPNDYTSRAVIGLVSIAIAQKDQKAMMSYLKQFLAIKDPSAEEPLIKAIRMETDRAEIGLGLDLAGEYASRYPNGKWRDEDDFLTANLLEMESQFRDIARARDLYSGILARYPESAFAAAARERLSYIDRHFYEVR